MQKAVITECSKLRVKSRKMESKRKKISRPTVSGQGLVEFALILPVLMLIVFGVLDLGRLFHAAITVANSAREGARYGTLNPPPDNNPSIIAAALAEAENSGINIPPGNISVSCPLGCNSGNPVRVTVEYDFQLIIGIVFGNPIIHFARYAEMMQP
jgi:Flp pilus assembly protein TadG